MDGYGCYGFVIEFPTILLIIDSVQQEIGVHVQVRRFLCRSPFKKKAEICSWKIQRRDSSINTPSQ